nr:unnamed protein product [Digitaria exilis]
MNVKIAATTALCLLLMTCGAEALLCSRRSSTFKGRVNLGAVVVVAAMVAVVGLGEGEHNQGSPCLRIQ